MIPDNVKQTIQTSYKKFLAQKGLQARQAQKQMVADIANYLFSISVGDDGNRSSTEKLCVIEAGTGTGKTLAYLAAGIPVAQALGKKLILSTATVTLQEQLVHKDLPDFNENSGLNFSYTLGKGRGRYLCLSRLEQLMANTDHNGDLFSGVTTNDRTDRVGVDRVGAEKVATDKIAADTLKMLFDDFASMRWNGEYDALPLPIAMNEWSQLTADNRSCTSRACSHFSHCPYFEARNRWEDVDVLVCNHDLVLADLALGGGIILPNTEDCIYVFDEAHHLADKALSHFSFNSQLQGSRQWLKQMTKSLAELLPHLSGSAALRQVVDEFATSARETDTLLALIYEHFFTELDWSADDRRKSERKDSAETYRFKGGAIDEQVREVAVDLQHHFAAMTRNADKLFGEIKKGLSDDKNSNESALSKDECEHWYPVLGLILNRCENQSQLWKLFSTVTEGTARPLAKWLKKLEHSDYVDISVSCSPLVADNILTDGLWKRAFGIVLTSATLTSGETFDAFKFKNGIPENSHYQMLKSPFNYAENAVLRIPDNFPDPTKSEKHTQGIVSYLSSMLNIAITDAALSGESEIQTVQQRSTPPEDKHRSILVLFSSRAQMNDVFFGMDNRLREYIIRQDDVSRSEAISQHKQKSDNQTISILFGLASFAEGLDLPGDYLTHVIIAKIPFSVPDDPLDAALSEWIEERGGNPFLEVSLPAAAMRLKQACGRLIRNETDRGVVSLLDSRLLSRRYGQYFLKSLPPFRLDFEPASID